MIRKINMLLGMAFVAMLALKGVKVFKDSRAAAAQTHVAASAERPDASHLAPCVCYGYWAGYTVENPISNRNGTVCPCGSSAVSCFVVSAMHSEWGHCHIVPDREWSKPGVIKKEESASRMLF